jgi:hypothetical protein
MVEGIDMLREQRGANSVTFNEIADHLFDFCDLHPEESGALQRFAAFLTAVEYIPHDHDADPDRGLPAPIAATVRA